MQKVRYGFANFFKSAYTLIEFYSTKNISILDLLGDEQCSRADEKQKYKNGIVPVSQEITIY